MWLCSIDIIKFQPIISEPVCVYPDNWGSYNPLPDSLRQLLWPFLRRIIKSQLKRSRSLNIWEQNDIKRFHRAEPQEETNQPYVRRRELCVHALCPRLPMRLHTMPGPFPARCADDGPRHRSALSDYCISIRGQNAEERKQCISEQAAWISRIVFRISRRFAKQNGHWFASGPPTLSPSTSPVHYPSAC